MLGEDDQRLLAVVTALEEDVAWHSPARFQVVANIARDLLTGPQADANEQLLQEEGEAWNELHQDTLHADEEHRAYLQRGTTIYDWSGRGGTAVWRAERQVSLQDFEDWLTGRTQADTAEYLIRPPGWFLFRPPGRQAAAPAPTPTGGLPQPYAAWTDEGRALAFPYRNRQAAWPLQRCPHPAGFEPVPGAEALLAAAAGLRPSESAATSKPYSSTGTTGSTLRTIPASASRWTFQWARRTTSASSAPRNAGAPWPRQEDLQHLRQARGNVREFTHVATRLNSWIGSRFRVHKAMWRWPGLSVAGEFLAGTSTELVQWLATVAHARSSRIVEQSMQQAWSYAFDRYAPPGDRSSRRRM
ncbi:hypothetical protein ABT255_17670 [Streptomyces mirabilis]|uniref:hypothetical protein n=1 Tax=Streptomyces mirabilis TaxID=68239 RepID=UPI0033172EE3